MSKQRYYLRRIENGTVQCSGLCNVETTLVVLKNAELREKMQGEISTTKHFLIKTTVQEISSGGPICVTPFKSLHFGKCRFQKSPFSTNTMSAFDRFRAIFKTDENVYKTIKNNI